MGLFTNFKKLIQEEQTKWEDDYKQYYNQAKKLESELRRVSTDYNQEVATINSERSGLKEAIDNLYKFLKEFGNIGDKITPFDFVNESWKTIDIDSPLDRSNDIDTGDTKNGMGDKVAFASILLLAPTLAPVSIIPAIIQRNKSKKEYESLVSKHEEAITNYSNNLEKYKDAIKTIKLAVEIANTYYTTICTVKEAIRNTILPELVGVRAFLYAKSIAEKVAYNEDLAMSVQPADIVELQNTRYNEHYIFLNNTVDYYFLIVEFFTKKILTNMLEDSVISEKEKRDFEQQIKCVKEKSSAVKEHLTFIKEN